MLSIHNLHKNYGIQPILQNISFNIRARERIGLIGPNGSGKTTLMRIPAGLEGPDSGIVTATRPKPSTGSGQRLRIGYLAQALEFDQGGTLRFALSLNAASAAELESEIASLASALSADPDSSELHSKYDSALNQLSAISEQPSVVLRSLGLANIPLTTPISQLRVTHSFKLA